MYLTGDLLTPLVIQVDSSSVELVFTADKSHHPNSQTMQLGFNATYVSGDDDEACYNDCSGHGVCVEGLCNCESSAFIGSDCSIEALQLVDGVSQSVDDLKVGGWAYFFFTAEEQFGWLVDVVDTGPVDSDAFLVVGKDYVPRLSTGAFDETDWLDWYYDRTDIHYVVKSRAEPGTYYVGVANHKKRATHKLSAQITLRTSAYGEKACILDCSGHGTCDTATGGCDCTGGWENTGWNYPSSCRFEVKDAQIDHTTEEDNLRVGDWNYFHVAVSSEQAGRRHLLVDLMVHTTHAQTILLVRKDEVPRLGQDLVPTYDAFEADFGDPNGFATVHGSLQSITVGMANLTEGDWYIGVYNLWGFTGVNEESHATAEYSLYVNLYSAGLPCPRSKARSVTATHRR